MATETVPEWLKELGLEPDELEGADDAVGPNPALEHLIDIDHDHRHAAYALNREAIQLAFDYDLFPEHPWATDEPMPDLRPMWEETARLHPRHQPYAENFDPETLPLFENWIDNLSRLPPD